MDLAYLVKFSSLLAFKLL